MLNLEVAFHREQFNFKYWIMFILNIMQIF